MTLKPDNYFIGILPSDPDWILDIKTEISYKYNCFKALNTEPHITLVAPFSMQHQEYKDFDLHAILPIERFNLEVTRIEAFAQRTLYLGIELSAELNALQTKCQRLVKKRKTIHEFIPHLTLANRDIPEERFERLWSEYGGRAYFKTIELDTICLYKYDYKWQRDQFFRLE